MAKLTGPTLDPMAAWLLHRGMKTLHLRVMRAADNAQSLAAWLLWQPQVARVDYPGVKEHPGHVVAARQMTGRVRGHDELRAQRTAWPPDAGSAKRCGSSPGG